MENKEDSKIKYLCVSGNTFDKSGVVNWVTAQELPGKYGVSPDECIFAENESDIASYDMDFLYSLTVLIPRSDGDYTLDQKLSNITESGIILP